jgi:tryptophan 2,3-dioxygenase
VASVTYGDYLRLATLLGLQTPRSGPEDSPVGVAEHFFIVTHQSTELWLKQIGKDLHLTIQCLDRHGAPASLTKAASLLSRATATLSLLTSHLALLDQHLDREDFRDFRAALDTASGAQSSQFRRLSRLLGVGASVDGALLASFIRRVEQDGLTLDRIFDSDEGVMASYRVVADALVDLGDGYHRWLTVHLALVSNMIGNDRGTGGSSGAQFLLRRLETPFADLREAASRPRS